LNIDQVMAIRNTKMQGEKLIIQIWFHKHSLLSISPLSSIEFNLFKRPNHNAQLFP